MLQQLKLRRRLAAHKARAPSPDHSRGLSRANDQAIRHHSQIRHRGQSGRRGRQGPRDQRGADRRDHSPCEQSIARCRRVAQRRSRAVSTSCLQWWARGPHARIRTPAAFPTLALHPRHCERQRSNPSRGKFERWIASSQALLAMTGHAFAFSRRAFARGLLRSSRPLQTVGAGNAGCPSASEWRGDRQTPRDRTGRCPFSHDACESPREHVARVPLREH
jgi:hypothetical protein